MHSTRPRRPPPRAARHTILVRPRVLLQQRAARRMASDAHAREGEKAQKQNRKAARAQRCV